VVTAVTVKAMGVNPRTVLVTRLCGGPGCHNKYTVLKTERALSAEERAVWHSP